MYIVDIDNVYKQLNDLEKLSKTVQDILDCRVEAVLQDMSITALCDLPEDEAITADKFLELTSNIVDQASQQLAGWVSVLTTNFFNDLDFSLNFKFGKKL